MHSSVRWLIGVALCVLYLLCLPLTAHAAGGPPNQYNDPGYQYGVDWDPETGGGAGSATTSGINDLTLNTFECQADGTTQGTLFVNPQCNASRGLFGLFANVVCRVENIFGAILGLVYCAVQNAILEPLLALLTLYVTVYGAMVLLGMVPHTFGEALTRIFKIGIVAAIALNAEIAIGVGYTFFITLTQTTISIVFELFTPDFVASNTVMADMIQAGYQSSPTNPDASRRLYLGENWMQNLDYVTHRIIGFFMKGGVGFAIVMVGLFFLMPPLFLIIVYLLISILKSLATAVIGYLLALLGITFLFSVAPIFVSFALFRVTSGWFDAWLRNLFSYTLQMMVVFVFLMIMIMIDIVSFFQQVGGMIRVYQNVFSFGWLMKPNTVFTLCRVEREGGLRSGEIIYYKFTVDGTPGNEIGNQYEGFPRCIPEYDLRAILSGDFSNLPPGLSQEQMEEIIDAVDGVKNGDIPLPNADGSNTPSGLETVSQIIQKANEDLKIPFMELITMTDLIFFLLVRFLSLIVLTYLLERFMRKVPHMASQLAGTGFAGRLGGGEQEPGDAPGLQQTNDFAGVDTGFAKFKQAAFKDGYYPRGFIRSGPSRFAQGVVAGIGGMGQGMLRSSIQRAGSFGLTNEMRRELLADQSVLESQREGLFAPTRGGIGRPEGIYSAGGRGSGELPSTIRRRRRSRYGR
jgi:hypothetical protein